MVLADAPAAGAVPGLPALGARRRHADLGRPAAARGSRHATDADRGRARTCRVRRLAGTGRRFAGAVDHTARGDSRLSDRIPDVSGKGCRSEYPRVPGNRLARHVRFGHRRLSGALRSPHSVAALHARAARASLPESCPIRLPLGAESPDVRPFPKGIVMYVPLKFAAVAAAAVCTVTLSACGGGRAPPRTRRPVRVGRPRGRRRRASPSGVGTAAVRSSAPAARPSRPTPSNPGSFAAMAQVPVATAASGNPLLSTLVTAVKKANLVDSLNSAPGHHGLRADQRARSRRSRRPTWTRCSPTTPTLKKILTYHVVPGRAHARRSSPARTRPCRARPDGHRQRHRLQGQRQLVGHLRQRADRERHRLHRRLRPDAEGLTRSLGARRGLRRAPGRVRKEVCDAVAATARAGGVLGGAVGSRPWPSCSRPLLAARRPGRWSPSAACVIDAAPTPVKEFAVAHASAPMTSPCCSAAIARRPGRLRRAARGAGPRDRRVGLAGAALLGLAGAAAALSRPAGAARRRAARRWSGAGDRRRAAGAAAAAARRSRPDPRRRRDVSTTGAASAPRRAPPSRHGGARRRTGRASPGAALVAGAAAAGCRRAAPRSAGVRRRCPASAGLRLPAPARPAPAAARRRWRPGFVTANADFYRVDTALTVPRVDLDGWRLRIDGHGRPPGRAVLRRPARPAAGRARHHAELRVQRGRRPLHRHRPLARRPARAAAARGRACRPGADQLSPAPSTA